MDRKIQMITVQIIPNHLTPHITLMETRDGKWPLAELTCLAELRIQRMAYISKPQMEPSFDKSIDLCRHDASVTCDVSSGNHLLFDVLGRYDIQLIWHLDCFPALATQVLQDTRLCIWMWGMVADRLRAYMCKCREYGCKLRLYQSLRMDHEQSLSI